MNARLARPSLRCQPFANASASASRGSLAASRASARSRSRSVGAASIGQVRRASGRRVVWRRTSSGSKSSQTASQNGLGSARRAVVGRRLAHEREQLPRPRACGVEEIAVAARRVGSLRAARPARCRARGASRRRRTETSERGAAATPARGRSRRPPRSFVSARARGRAPRHDPARRPHRREPSPGRAPRGRRPRGS